MAMGPQKTCIRLASSIDFRRGNVISALAGEGLFARQAH